MRRIWQSFAFGWVLTLASPDARPGPAPAPSATLASDTVPELDAAVRAIASDRALAGANVGIAILDVDTGRMLAAVNEHLAVNPASNAKLYTAGAALATLRAEHRYETTLSGSLEGDSVRLLALRGYGDPSLTTADLWSLVQGLKEYGVTRVDGDILVDQAFYDDQTTPAAFDQQPNEWASFRAPISAVALNENCVTMTVRPSTASRSHLHARPKSSQAPQASGLHRCNI
jgi:D-alanyl-D-alanine carboxypeptidase/D-alanyl-D-alanine-endopeptidase (penicillin-binding protein 4)